MAAILKKNSSKRSTGHKVNANVLPRGRKSKKIKSFNVIDILINEVLISFNSL